MFQTPKRIDRVLAVSVYADTDEDTIHKHMSEQIYPHALTTVQRVKDLLGITVTNADPVLLRLINGATDFIQGYCNEFFAQKTYTNDLYSIWGERQEYLMLNHGNVTSLSSFQYRAGTPSNPIWTDFLADQYELVEPDPSGMCKSGMIRIYAGFAPLLYTSTNAIRATYTAGFLISWSDFGNLAKHNLPADLTNLCESLVTRYWKHRESSGKKTESIKDSNVSWNDFLDSFDTDVLERYVRPVRFI